MRSSRHHYIGVQFIILDSLKPSLRLVPVVLSVAACSSFHRVPRSIPAPSNGRAASTKTDSPSPPLFTSRDGPPTSFVASTSDAKTTRIVTVRDGLTKPVLFRLATEYLIEKHNTVQVSDPNAGYLMTPWQATLARDGVPELRYRTRIILLFLGDDWKQLSVHAEANWLRGEEWEYGYDAALLDSVTTQLTARLGKRA